MAECPDHGYSEWSSLGMHFQTIGDKSSGFGMLFGHAVSSTFLNQLENEIVGTNMVPPWVVNPYGNTLHFGSMQGYIADYVDAWTYFQCRLTNVEFTDYLYRWNADNEWREAFRDPTSIWYATEHYPDAWEAGHETRTKRIAEIRNARNMNDG